MGHVREQRAIKLLENALLEYLKDGTIPTTGELELAYKEEQEEHGDLVRSAVRRAELPLTMEESSAAEFNSFLDGLAQDLDVLFKALTQVSSAGLSSLKEWSSRANSLEARLSKLLTRCESLVLLEGDSAGYVSFVEDNFTSIENVSDETTAFVDTDNGDVIVSISSGDGKSIEQGTAISLTGAKSTFNLIRQDKTVKVQNINGLSINPIFHNNDLIWTQQVIASETGKRIAGELTIELPEEKDVTQITLTSDIPNNASPTTVSLQYSRDGYSWELPLSEADTQSGEGNFVFRFKKTGMKYFKFIVSKVSNDGTNENNEPIYVFSFGQIKVYSQVFETGVGKELYTTLREPTLGGNNISFARATLEVCDQVPPDDTTIDYFLRAYDGSGYTNWIKTIPLNRKANQTNLTNFNRSSGYAVVDFSTPQNLNTENIATTFDSSLNAESLNLLRNFGSTGLSYRLGGVNDTFANFYIPVSLDLISDVVFTRNYGYQEAKFPTLTQDKTVRDVETGWGLLSQGTYYCAFYISDPKGRKFNFGETKAEIDGRLETGEDVEVSQGWHVFKTNRANWVSLTGSVNPTTEAGLESIDPLYPYNHKYIIEGFEYSSLYKGNRKPYLGVDRYCQYCSAIQSTSTQEVGTSRRVGIFDVLTSQLNTSVFALDEIDTEKVVLLMKVNSGQADQVNERVRLYYTRRYESFTGVELKASLKTDNFSRTPELSYYRIRVK